MRMFGIFALVSSLFTAAPASAAETQPSLWGSLGNQVLAHDTLTSLDTNHDGLVSHDEYAAKGDAEFKALDTNVDNNLSAEEIAASKKKDYGF